MMTKKINIINWKRKQHYDFFKVYDNPFFNICSEIDVSQLKKYCTKNDLSFFICLLYKSIQTANQIKEFKYRIKADEVIEFETVYAGSTVLNKDETFNFCYFDYDENFEVFYQNAKKQLAMNNQNKQKFDGRNTDLDIIHYSVIPWITFTSFSHPRKFGNDDSVPKIVFGKYTKKNNKLMLPISIEVHHALMDGFHVAKYLKLFQENLDK